METIDLTPTWVEWTRVLTRLVKAGETKAVSHLLPDLQTMAKAADERNDLIKKHKIRMDFNPGTVEMPWTKIVVHGVVQDQPKTVRKALPEEKPDFWSCYTVTTPDRLEYCIADFATEKEAIDFALVLKNLAVMYMPAYNGKRIANQLQDDLPEMDGPVHGSDAVDSLTRCWAWVREIFNHDLH